MPRSNWKGFISFGLVSIPVILFPTDNKRADISFHQIDKRNNARIKYQRINSETGKAVDWKDIVKGYAYDKETTIPVPDEILKKIAGENVRTIAIQQFISRKEFDAITIDKSYFIVPDKKGEKGYIILREALQESEKIGIAKVVISTKEYLAAIMPYKNNALILFLIKYAQEMRKLEELNFPEEEISAYKINQKEITIAKQLINSMTTKWKPTSYTDTYQETIHKWVDEAVKKVPHTAKMKSKKAHATNVIDFVDLLRKSLAKPAKIKKVKKIKKIAQPSSHKAVKHATKH